MKIENHAVNTETGKEPKNAGTDMAKVFKILSIVLLIFTLFIGVRTVVTINAAQKEAAEGEAELEKLKAELEAKGGAASKEQKEGDNADGLVEDSSDKGAEFLKKLLTWDSLDAYNSVRSWLKDTYGVDKKDALLVSFMPKMEEDAFGDANMSFKEAETYVLGEDGGLTSYFALCKVANHINGNNGTGKVGVFYTIDKQGTVSGISAYALVR